MSEKAELKKRVEAKRKELEAELAKAKAAARGASNDATKAIQAKLEALQSYLADGWEDLSESVSAKLNDWLK